jgi:hypothetical protein
VFHQLFEPTVLLVILPDIKPLLTRPSGVGLSSFNNERLQFTAELKVQTNGSLPQRMEPYMNNEPSPPSEPENPHWELLRDLAKFQAKLVVDGLRDVLMSPVSIVAAIAGMIVDRKDPQALFRQTLHFGRRTERWINLFDGSSADSAREEPGIDELFAKLERRIVDQYERGGATASAKHAIDRSLDGVHRGLDRLKGQVSDDKTEITGHDKGAG